MKKKILAILMATLTVGSLLSGCGGAQSSDANGNQESSKHRQIRNRIHEKTFNRSHPFYWLSTFSASRSDCH